MRRSINGTYHPIFLRKIFRIRSHSLDNWNKIRSKVHLVNWIAFRKNRPIVLPWIIPVRLFPHDQQLLIFPLAGLQPKNVDFPGPGQYATTRPWEQSDFHAKQIPFNGTASRNDKRSFTHAGIQHVCVDSLCSTIMFFSFLFLVLSGRRRWSL